MNRDLCVVVSVKGNHLTQLINYANDRLQGRTSGGGGIVSDPDTPIEDHDMSGLSGTVAFTAIASEARSQMAFKNLIT